MKKLFKDTNGIIGGRPIIFTGEEEVDGVEKLGEFEDTWEAKNALADMVSTEEQKQFAMIFSFVEI